MLDREVYRTSCQRMEERQLQLSDRRRFGQKQCHFCRKSFGEMKMYKDHLKYDFSCWKLRKQEERLAQRRTTKKRNNVRTDSEYGYESDHSDSGRGTSSDSSSCNDEDGVNPSIRMTLGQSQDRQFEVLMVSENLPTKKSVQKPVPKRRKVKMPECTNPMVTIKSELLEDLQTTEIKQEEAGVSNDSIINTQETEDFKPKVFIPGSEKPSTGIRMLIDKNDMSVVMASEHLEDKEVFDDACPDEESSMKDKDVKPQIGELGHNIQAGIKMTFAKEKPDQNEYAVTMASELVPTDIFDTEFIMCSNSECPKIGNHVCAFPTFRETGGFYKTKGVLNIKKSNKTGKPKFVPFNQTFLKTLGCSFYFKAYHSHIEVRCRSTNTKNAERFKIMLYEKNSQSSTIGTLGSSKFKASSSIPTNNFEGDFIKYKIVIDKHPRGSYLFT